MEVFRPVGRKLLNERWGRSRGGGKRKGERQKLSVPGKKRGKAFSFLSLQGEESLNFGVKRERPEREGKGRKGKGRRKLLTVFLPLAEGVYPFFGGKGRPKESPEKGGGGGGEIVSGLSALEEGKGSTGFLISLESPRKGRGKYSILIGGTAPFIRGGLPGFFFYHGKGEKGKMSRPLYEGLRVH